MRRFDAQTLMIFCFSWN